MRERNMLASQIEGVTALEAEVADTLELIALAEADDDSQLAGEGIIALRRAADEAKRREIESLLSGEADMRDAFLEVNAGAGGTEAQDWAEMLARMYTRWAEARGYKVQMLEQSEGEQAGLKSATYQISGPNAYGWLKTEGGVHRLGPHLPLRQQRAAADLLRQRLRLSGDRRHDPDRHQPGRPESRHIPGVRRRRSAHQQDRVRDPHHPTCRAAS